LTPLAIQENKVTNGTSSLNRSSLTPVILERASQDTANQQKKSVFKRFASKFKV